MLSRRIKDNQINKLAKAYFIDELGMNEKQIPEASRNLIGAFESLYRIQKRLTKKPYEK